jgi:methylated-DNA-[protein]-cysteine S-methyltransferase
LFTAFASAVALLLRNSHLKYTLGIEFFLSTLHHVMAQPSVVIYTPRVEAPSALGMHDEEWSTSVAPSKPVDGDGSTSLTSPGDGDEEASRAKIAAHPGLSDFRRRTLLLLLQVPRGRFTTYQALADALGKRRAARAIGGVMRSNPFAPAVPCHRCLPSDRRVGGYFGENDVRSAKVQRKIRVLKEEGVEFDDVGKAVGEPFKDFR